MGDIAQLWTNIGPLFHDWNMMLPSNRKNLTDFLFYYICQYVYKTDTKKQKNIMSFFLQWSLLG